MIFRKKLIDLLTELTYSDNEGTILLNKVFWYSFLELETTLLEMLKLSGIEEDKVKIHPIVKMNITVDEDGILILPITNMYLS